MKTFLLTLIACSVLNGCAVTKGTENQAVQKAIVLQQQIISDPLFEQILQELDSSKSIDWGDGRTDIIQQSLSGYKSNIEWILSKYKTKGGFSKDSVFLWRKFNPFSSTTAATSTCVDKTRLNKWNLTNDEYSLVNTLIHERAHSFCLNHGVDQTRAINQCDAAYIMGDLAEILILYRKGIKEREMDKPICPALLKIIEEYKLMTIK